MDPASSRFDDDGNDAGGSGGEEERAAEAKLSRFESRFEQEKRDQVRNNRQEEYDDDPEEEVGSGTPPVMEAVKSKEEILEEMGLNIRRLMTGLLLEVTAEELEETASSVLKKARNRTTAKPQLKTMLSGYGSGSDSQSESESDGDSEDDLQSVLKKKKKQFVKTKSKILDFCEEETAAYKVREKKWLGGGGGKEKKRQQS